MSLGKNLQFLRKMRNGMTQEELAEKMNTSRQTISKWELDAAYPEMDKAVELCRFFSCSLDQLIREDMNAGSEAYSDIRVEELAEFRYIRYAVISMEPETDAISHVRNWAASCRIEQPEIIGWDFPVLSPEQINVFHMHGYTAAWILPREQELSGCGAEIVTQNKQKYAAITIKNPSQAPFTIIPNGYKLLMSYLQANGLDHREDTDYLPCFEREYCKDGIDFMDIYIAVC